ncbi:MAG: hypothetical protein E6J42_08895 [Chloroflexi bacterium]|nr:MAG: hypothetical protein E6J42_08895 [Chloroflexota bacterium]
MRFVIGLLLGFGIGMAAAILFAPEKKPESPRWPEGHPARMSLDGNKGATGGLQETVRGLQERVNEAWEEARKASMEAEREIQARYEEMKRRGAAAKK